MSANVPGALAEAAAGAWLLGTAELTAGDLTAMLLTSGRDAAVRRRPPRRGRAGEGLSPERHAELVRRLVAAGRNVVVTGSAAEAALATAPGRPSVVLLGPVSPRGVGAAGDFTPSGPLERAPRVTRMPTGPTAAGWRSSPGR